ncbi:histidine kinase [Oerskovia sp. M15]
MTALAAAAGVAVDNARLYEDGRRVAVLEDRERIARDLHDVVIQRIFASAMTLMSTTKHIENDLVRSRVEEAVDDLDDTIREIRSTIFALQATTPRRRAFRSGSPPRRRRDVSPGLRALGRHRERRLVARARRGRGPARGRRGRGSHERRPARARVPGRRAAAGHRRHDRAERGGRRDRLRRRRRRGPPGRPAQPADARRGAAREACRGTRRGRGHRDRGSGRAGGGYADGASADPPTARGTALVWRIPNS